MESREFKDAIYEQFARIGSAFSSPKRIEIVDLLANGERSVESIALATSMSVANTSRHLQVLRQSGLVVSRREGLFSVYRVADESVIKGYRALRDLADQRISDVRQLATAFFNEVDGATPIEFDELMSKSKSGDVVLVDVRPREEFAAGHLPGALNIPLEEIASHLHEFRADTVIAAYCRGPYCVLAAEAVAFFRSVGISARRLSVDPHEWLENHATPTAKAPPARRQESPTSI